MALRGVAVGGGSPEAAAEVGEAVEAAVGADEDVGVVVAVEVFAEPGHQERGIARWQAGRRGRRCTS